MILFVWSSQEVAAVSEKLSDTRMFYEGKLAGLEKANGELAEKNDALEKGKDAELEKMGEKMFLLEELKNTLKDQLLWNIRVPCLSMFSRNGCLFCPWFLLCSCLFEMTGK